MIDIDKLLKGKHITVVFDEPKNMKQVTVYCPVCYTSKTYANWFSWILHTPFHWFGKRRIKCDKCHVYSYVRRIK